MNLIDQNGQPVDLADLSEDDQLAVMNYRAGYTRGHREALEAVAKSIAEGKVPGVALEGAGAKAVAPAASGNELTINLAVDGLRVTSMPDRTTVRRIERDARGLITSTVDVETDA